MPVLKVQTNQLLSDKKISAFMKSTSKLIATKLAKPESYVMIAFEPPQPMLFAGSDEPLAYLELKSIGLQDSQTADLSASLCQLLNDELNIPQERVYIEFTDAPRKMWGWNGGTF